MQVFLKGVLEIVDYGNGIIALGLDSRPLTQQQSEVLRQLFPNTYNDVDRLLDKEALLVAATDDPWEVHGAATCTQVWTAPRAQAKRSRPDLDVKG